MSKARRYQTKQFWPRWSEPWALNSEAKTKDNPWNPSPRKSRVRVKYEDQRQFFNKKFITTA